MAYYSFFSYDLGTNLYVSHIIPQPDNNSLGCYNPLEKAVPYDLFGRFLPQITEARNNNHNYDSDTIRIGMIYYNGAVRFSYLAKVSYIANTGMVRFYIGYNSSTSSKPSSPSSWTHNKYSEKGFEHILENRQLGYLYCHDLYGRSFVAPPPNYNGEHTLFLSVGGVQNRVGTIKPGSGSRPDGYVEYTSTAGYEHDRAEIPNCTPCSLTGSTSIEQQLLVGYMGTSEDFYTSQPGLQFTSDDGSYDPDPPAPPEPPEPPTPSDDPNDEGQPSKPDGGDGDHTPTYEPVPIPNKPSMGSATAGFVTMYKLGLAAINQWASDMFASSVWEAIKLFFSNPIDFMVGCMLLPFEPDTGSSYKPKFGAVSFAHAYPIVSNQYKDIDCGDLAISKYWGSCFDYEPYTKIQIWLPYIGYRDLPVDEIMDSTINVKYRIDCLTGDCVAFVSTTTAIPGQLGPTVNRVISQFYGNCGVRVPFGSVSFDAAVAASINLIGAAATMGLSKGPGSVMMGGSRGGASGAHPTSSGVVGMATDEGYSEPSASGLIGAGVSAVESAKPTVQKGGAAGASTGYMSIQTPYLIKRIPRQNLPDNFMNIKGYPSNIGGKLADFTGLAIVDEIQLNDIPALEGERREIIQWLQGGVII